MSVYLLYSQATQESGSALAERLEIPGGLSPPRERLDLLIRWGNAEGVSLRPHRVMNKKSAILVAIDKVRTFEVLSNNGILTPRVVDEYNGKPLLARRNYASQGSGITLILQRRDLLINRDYDFLVEYIPTKCEYRVHVFRDNFLTSNSQRTYSILSLHEKVPSGPEPKVPYIRNYDHGWRFKHPSPSRDLDPIKDVAIRSIDILGLDFGAVDVIEGEDDGIYVLEINTGPGIIARTPGLESMNMERYYEALRPICEHYA